MQIEDSSACAVCADDRLQHIDAQRTDGATARQLAAAFDLDLQLVFAHVWHTWSPPKRHRLGRGSYKHYRNGIRLDEDGTSVWLKLTPTKRGLWARVDLTDLSLVQRCTNWEVSTSLPYAHARQSIARRKQRIFMHMLIVPPVEGLEIDHVNGDRLDNRRSNLRLVTHAENMQNRRGANRNSPSGIRGVTPSLKHGKVIWRGQVMVSGKHFSRDFPYTDEGKQSAAAWVQQKRRELMPYANG